MIPIRDDNPIQSTPVVTYALMATCTLVFLWQISLGRAGYHGAMYAFGLIPAVVSGHAVLPPELDVVPGYLTVVTSMFMHGGFMHLAGNLLFLWIFADNIEDAMGRFRFVAFYLLCGLGAAIAQVLPDVRSEIPMVGASGAISGVLGAYLLLFPYSRVLVMIPLGIVLHMVRLPAMAVLGLWFLIQLISSFMDQGGGGVAFRAHLGGFVAGMLLLPVFSRQRES